MDLSILIVSYDTKPLLRASLESVFAAKNGSSFEVLVVDNHSRDGSADMVRAEFPAVRLLANDTNVGFARGVNQAVRESSGRYVLVLNSDTVLPEEGVEPLLRFADEEYRRRRAGIVGARLLNADGSLQYSMGRFPTLRRTLTDAFRPRPRRKYAFAGYDAPGEADWVTGACVLVRRELLEDVGLLDENFFLYYEDVDLCWRARRKGWTVVFFPGFEVRHRNPHCRREESREFVPVEIRRSHLYYYRKNYSAASYSALWLLTLAWAAGILAVSRLPLPGANGRLHRTGHLARRLLREVLFNGRDNGKPHTPPDAA